MTIILLFLGFLVGAFIMTMGGGGGAFYLGIMTGVAHLSPGTAAATSLFTAIPALAVGCYSHYRTGNMRFHAGNEILMTAVPATIIGSLAAPHIPEVVYSWAIAVIFVVLGVQMLRQSFARKVKKATQPAWFAYVLGAISGLMVGVAGLSGGGPIMAGLMLMGLRHASCGSDFFVRFSCFVSHRLPFARHPRHDCLAGRWLIDVRLAGWCRHYPAYSQSLRSAPADSYLAANSWDHAPDNGGGPGLVTQFN